MDDPLFENEWWHVDLHPDHGERMSDGLGKAKICTIGADRDNAVERALHLVRATYPEIGSWIIDKVTNLNDVEYWNET